MSSASYPIVTGSKKGIQLDPRTKLHSPADHHHPDRSVPAMKGS